MMRRSCENWCKSKRKAHAKCAEKNKKDGGKEIEHELERIKKFCLVVRVIAHTQFKKLNSLIKWAHIVESKSTVAKTPPPKLTFAKLLFEKEIAADAIFAKDEKIDVLGVTKGQGHEGVTTGWGVT